MIKDAIAKSLVDLGLEKSSMSGFGEYYAQKLSGDCSIVVQTNIVSKGRSQIINPRFGFRSEVVEGLYSELRRSGDLYTCECLFSTLFGIDERLWGVPKTSSGSSEASLISSKLEGFLAEHRAKPPNLPYLASLLETRRWGVRFIWKLPVIYFLMGHRDTAARRIADSEESLKAPGMPLLADFESFKNKFLSMLESEQQ
ncbi:MAG: hypothetical protein H7A19_07845 [Rhodanobacteraceae bacterium]|nr:hypothetical protein [Rhodanobacteraceae bacterium]